MTKRKNSAKGDKTGPFLLGRDRFAKISAVEGIRPTAAMTKRANEAQARGLTAEEYRRTIIRSHRKD